METDGVQTVEYVDAICLDKSIILNDGTTTATITTIDGQSLPVTFIVSQPLEEDVICVNAVKDSANAENCGITNDPNGTFKEGENEEKLAAGEAEHESLEIHTVMNSTAKLARLEDFMDVVTTYKCKFCRFSCPWKSGLMSHIRCCHIKEKNSIATLKETEIKSVTAIHEEMQPSPENCNEAPHSDEDPPTEDTPKGGRSTAATSSKLRTEEETSNSSIESPVQERHIFLCGQCSDGFASLDECKQHMINDHHLKLSQDTVKAVRKRGRPRTRQPKEEKGPAKKRVKKEVAPKEPKKRKTLYMNLEDELDCCIRRKLRTGYVNDRAFRCAKNGCGHRFTSDSNLNYHFSSHSSSTEKPFVCQECREEFLNWRALAMHLWRDHTIDIDLYSCTECNYKAFSFFKVENHRKIHSDERPYVCETCGKSFKQISQLRNHIVIHLDRRNLPEKRWYSEQQCHTCGRKFSDTKCLRKHEQAVHSRLKPFVCTFCGHLSARKAMLELHMRQHTGEKPFMCDHCDYRTGDHNSLRRHRMRHTGDKPYKCPHCPYACIQAISYKTHLRNRHPGMDGLYSCTMCTFKTVSKENFLHHTADHKRMAESKAEDSAAENISPAGPEPEISMETPDGPSSVQMQLTDNALQQLEGILPGNITAAQLIYSCLNAMSQDGGGPVTLPPGVTLNIPSSGDGSSLDGTQTITIQVPSGEDAEPYYFTIQQQDGNTAAIIVPEEAQLTEQDMSGATESLDCGVIVPDQEVSEQLRSENSDLVIAHMDSLPEAGQMC